MRQPTGLTVDLQDRFTDMSRRVFTDRARRRFVGWTPAEWADRFARQEPHLEDALGGICWDYSDRAVVCAVVLLLDNLAGPDLDDPRGQRRAIARGFRVVADVLEADSRRGAAS